MQTMDYVRKKILIGISALILLALTLIGITYAYFTAKVSGNTEAKSIEVTAAKLELTYNDGNGTVIVEKVVPGTVMKTKTFSVKNTGTKEIASYDVLMEVIENELDEYGDLTYELTCASDGETCQGISGTFPTEDKVLITNSIKVGVTHSYALTLTYNESGKNQSDDMNKKIEGNIIIQDEDKYAEN